MIYDDALAAKKIPDSSHWQMLMQVSQTELLLCIVTVTAFLWLENSLKIDEQLALAE